MNYEKICKLIDGVIESEFNNVQEFREKDFSDKNIEQQQLDKTSSELMDKLMETLSEDQQDILDKLEVALTNGWVNLCRFYFKEGVAAGLTNLKFIDCVDYVGCYIR